MTRRKPIARTYRTHQWQSFRDRRASAYEGEGDDGLETSRHRGGLEEIGVG